MVLGLSSALPLIQHSAIKILDLSQHSDHILNSFTHFLPSTRSKTKFLVLTFKTLHGLALCFSLLFNTTVPLWLAFTLLAPPTSAKGLLLLLMTLPFCSCCPLCLELPTCKMPLHLFPSNPSSKTNVSMKTLEGPLVL